MFAPNYVATMSRVDRQGEDECQRRTRRGRSFRRSPPATMFNLFSVHAPRRPKVAYLRTYAGAFSPRALSTRSPLVRSGAVLSRESVMRSIPRDGNLDATCSCSAKATPFCTGACSTPASTSYSRVSARSRSGARVLRFRSLRTPRRAAEARAKVAGRRGRRSHARRRRAPPAQGGLHGFDDAGADRRADERHPAREGTRARTLARPRDDRAVRRGSGDLLQGRVCLGGWCCSMCTERFTTPGSGPMRLVSTPAASGVSPLPHSI